MKNFISILIASLLVVGCTRLTESQVAIKQYDIRVKLSDHFDSLQIHAGLVINGNLKSDDTLKFFLGKDFSNVIIKDVNVTKGESSFFPT